MPGWCHPPEEDVTDDLGPLELGQRRRLPHGGILEAPRLLARCPRAARDASGRSRPAADLARTAARSPRASRPGAATHERIAAVDRLAQKSAIWARRSASIARVGASRPPVSGRCEFLRSVLPAPGALLAASLAPVLRLCSCVWRGSSLRSRTSRHSECHFRQPLACGARAAGRLGAELRRDVGRRQRLARFERDFGGEQQLVELVELLDQAVDRRRAHLRPAAGELPDVVELVVDRDFSREPVGVPVTA